ncbi:hypothetical protein RB2150_07083 [Rhodobacterales bacterium HTCC2150]|nr:hypothetical protein RB2150_07083 [Rhodobacterales bacterium HTCC2150] [Rhodobacteraceae bacterium HTCC2150]
MKTEHEMHKRRFGRNLGVGLLLVSFVAVVFGLTIAKVTGVGLKDRFDPASASSQTGISG